MSRLPWAQPCTARRRDGSPCGSYAIRGGSVCRMHGGAAPQVKHAAHMRLLEARWASYSERHKQSITSTLLGLELTEGQG